MQHCLSNCRVVDLREGKQEGKKINPKCYSSSRSRTLYVCRTYLIRLGEYNNSSRTGMHTALRLRCRHALHSMDTALGQENTVYATSAASVVVSITVFELSAAATTTAVRNSRYSMLDATSFACRTLHHLPCPAAGLQRWQCRSVNAMREVRSCRRCSHVTWSPELVHEQKAQKHLNHLCDLIGAKHEA